MLHILKKDGFWSKTMYCGKKVSVFSVGSPKKQTPKGMRDCPACKRKTGW